METELTVAASVAWLIPFIVSLLKGRRWPAAVNMALSGVAAFAVATLGIVVSGEVDFDNGIQDPETWFLAAGLAFAESQVVYRLILKGITPMAVLNAKLTDAIWAPVPEGVPLGDALHVGVRDGADVPPSERPPL